MTPLSTVINKCFFSPRGVTLHLYKANKATLLVRIIITASASRSGLTGGDCFYITRFIHCKCKNKSIVYVKYILESEELCLEQLTICVVTRSPTLWR